MPLNFGYVGLGKEAACGVSVASSVFLRLQEVPSLELEQRYAEVPGIDDFGISTAIATTRSGRGNISMVVTPGSFGHVLAALMGSPSTTGTSPNFTHTYVPKPLVPSYTVGVLDGTGVKRLVGSKVSELTLSHSVDGLLVARSDWVGIDEIVGGDAETTTLETTYFSQRVVGISFNGDNHDARAEDLEVRLSFQKEIQYGFGNRVGTSCEPTGEGEVTAQITLRFSEANDAGKFVDYINGTTRSVSISWTHSADTSLAVAFTAYITADPRALQNRDLRTARVRLSLRAVRAGSPLVTVTLKNQVAYY